MTAITSTTTERLIPGGKIYFDAFDSAGNLTGERYLGLTPGFSISIKSDSIQSYTTEEGLRTLDMEILTGITRTGKLSCRQVSFDNISNFIIADVSTYTQTGTTVTDEAISVLPDRYYQLGRVAGNPVGRQGISAVTVTAGDAAITWTADAVKTVGSYVKGVTDPTYYFRCIAVEGDAKTHASTEPTWSSAANPGQTIVDDKVTWANMGLLAPTATPTTGDYTLDATLGRIYVLSTAHVHPTILNPWKVDYTYASNSRSRIASSAIAKVTGALRFIASNMQGENRDIFAPNVLLAPSGDWTIKADKPDFIELAWDLTFSQGLNGEAALYIDGRAV